MVIRQTVRTVARRVRFGVTNENIDSRFDELVIHEVTEVQQQAASQQSSTPLTQEEWIRQLPAEVLLHRPQRSGALVGCWK